MLIKFSVENWMSFREKVEFSMIASRERQHRDRVSLVKKYPFRILPVASIYGANASGKTNLFKAIYFAKRLIVKGTQQPESQISTKVFLLDPECADQPSKFYFELLIDEVVYVYQFSVTRKKVVEEKLEIIKSSSEKTLFHRMDGTPHFDESLAKDPFLNFAFQGTRDNQLFLTNSVSQNVHIFKPVYDWFDKILELVAPDSRFNPMEIVLNERLIENISKRISQFDTGIDRIESIEIPLEKIQSIPKEMLNDLQEEVKEGMIVGLWNEARAERLLVFRKEGVLYAEKLYSYHPTVDGQTVQFEIREESDGSQRIIELLPAFIDVSSKSCKRVYLVDEIDRSLHSLITRQLIGNYLSACSPESRTQLIFTTHDVLLMDQDLLRRDEMWVVEKNALGASALRSFSEYRDVRYDKDIRKSYLQGRLGGIPRILTNIALGDKCSTDKNRSKDGV